MLGGISGVGIDEHSGVSSNLSSSTDSSITLVLFLSLLLYSAGAMMFNWLGREKIRLISKCLSSAQVSHLVIVLHIHADHKVTLLSLKRVS